MKCPGCGAEIPEGCLLCENCGKEIQMVPDYEPEVENSIAETLSGVAENLITSDHDVPEDEQAFEKADVKDRKLLRIGALVILLLIVLTIFLSASAYFGSPNYQIQRAGEFAEKKDYQSALKALDQAIAQGGDYAQIKLMMATYEQAMGNNDEFLNQLLSIINYENATEPEVAQAYELIVNYDVGMKDYNAINSLMLSCQYSSIQEKYSEYMAQAPEFNYVEGSYNEVIPLKILANTTGHIYYTTDGSKPDSSSTEYTSPVFLDSGDYVITAVFINQYGIKSPFSQSKYHVDVSAPFAPEVDAYSGEFYTPQLIHVEVAEGCTVYYTTDGTDPTIDSTMYSGFLPMPLGKTTMKFVAIDEHQVSSEVTVRNYDLELMTSYTKDDAQTVLLNYQVDQGVIQSKTGLMTDDSGNSMYYSFACCVTIQDQGDFYIFSEYIIHADDTKEKTGNYYAVGIYNLPVYSTQYDAKTGTFALSSPQLNSTEELDPVQAD